MSPYSDDHGPEDEAHLRRARFGGPPGVLGVGVFFAQADPRDDVPIGLVGAARPRDLIDELNRARPNVLHLSGHGGLTGIALEDDQGLAVDMSTAQLVRLVGTADSALRLVVMNTCESAQQAQPMVATVDAAIGMTRSIGDGKVELCAREVREPCMSAHHSRPRLRTDPCTSARTPP